MRKFVLSNAWDVIENFMVNPKNEYMDMKTLNALRLFLTSLKRF